MEHVVICQHSHLKPQILPPHLKQFKEQAHHYPLPILVAVPNNSPPAVVANQEDSPADRQEDNSPVVVHQETRKVGQGVHSKVEAAREVNSKAQAVLEVNKKEKVVKEVNSKVEVVREVNSKVKVVKEVNSKAKAVREVNSKEKVVKEVNSKAEAVQKVNSKAASSVDRVDALKN